MKTVGIHSEFITLGQLLKLAGVAQTGGEARSVLASAGVLVNGRPESRRGRKLRQGDVVSVESPALVLKIVGEACRSPRRGHNAK